MKQKSLTFSELREKNSKRCESVFHPIDAWDESSWACALAGEVGEFCNIIKKRKRVRDEFNNHKISSKKAFHKIGILHEAACKELADILAYLDLNATNLGVKLEDITIKKFNEVSDKVGSKIKL